MEVHHEQSFWASVARGKYLGNGSTAFVFLHEGAAVKIPFHFSDASSPSLDGEIEAIRSEQSIYQRLNNCWGVVPYLSCTESTITLTYMENGDLRRYLETYRPPQSLQLSWMRDMARALMNIHECGVLVEDITSRNFLLDSNLSIYFCDFATSELVDTQGCLVDIELGQFGAVMYEIVTGKQIKFQVLYDEAGSARLPTNLPSTNDAWLGSTIKKCWTGAFLDAHELLKELESVRLDEKPTYRISATIFHYWMSLRFTPLLGVTAGALALAAIWAWKPPRTSWLHSS
ncbi:hypothetical protein DV736_g3653, partial [Chaetothyriales sp. CBS 134916]